MGRKNFYFSFLAILICFFTLGGLAALRLERFSIWGNDLRRVDLLSQIRKKEDPVIKDTSLALALKEIAVPHADSLVISDTLFVSPFLIDYSPDSLNGLGGFMKKLHLLAQKKNRKIRIAYFGDSMIEGDLITQDLREFFQKKFGGEGVGFVPITSATAGFRATIKHKFSADFKTVNLLQASREFPLGISGYTAIPYASVPRSVDTASATSKVSWVTYEAVPQKRLSVFNDVRLFYGPVSSPQQITVAGSGNPSSVSLSGKDMVNSISLSARSSRKISVSFPFTEPVSLFGMSFESDSGIILDNFSFRGNSGLPLTKIPSGLLRKFDELASYDLIIIHYGLNATNPELKDYSWYKRGLQNVVNHLKRSFPEASFLMVSVSDRSYNLNGEYITDPSVLRIVKLQKEIAENSNIAFYNLFEAMGGYNSMVKWATADTALANKDFTHLNHRGARKVAKQMYKDIMSEYSHFSGKGNS